jgi:thioredoxin reductase (NADPH)
MTGFIKDENGNFKGLEVKDKITGETEELIADGAFIFIGLIPNIDSVKRLIKLNKQGFITTTGLGETSVEGIFAARDCRESTIVQVAVATGKGVLSSYGVRQYFK